MNEIVNTVKIIQSRNIKLNQFPAANNWRH